MSRLMKQLINRNGLDVLLTCDAKHQAEAVAQTKRFLATLPEFPLVREEMDWRAEGGSREGIVIPSKVMYVGLGGNFRMLGEEYAPDLLGAEKISHIGISLGQHSNLGGAMSFDECR
jgi:hypothetical protein